MGHQEVHTMEEKAHMHTGPTTYAMLKVYYCVIYY